jgi:hypothetical protein
VRGLSLVGGVDSAAIRFMHRLAGRQPAADGSDAGADNLRVGRPTVPVLRHQLIDQLLQPGW